MSQPMASAKKRPLYERIENAVTSILFFFGKLFLLAMLCGLAYLWVIVLYALMNPVEANSPTTMCIPAAAVEMGYCRDQHDWGATAPHLYRPTGANNG